VDWREDDWTGSTKPAAWVPFARVSVIFQLLDVRVNAAGNETRVAGPARGVGQSN
jgi:hypothetical protein